jgi:hypothetical protein
VLAPIMPPLAQPSQITIFDIGARAVAGEALSLRARRVNACASIRGPS